MFAVLLAEDFNQIDAIGTDLLRSYIAQSVEEDSTHLVNSILVLQCDLWVVCVVRQIHALQHRLLELERVVTLEPGEELDEDVAEQMVDLDANIFVLDQAKPASDRVLEQKREAIQV